MNERILMPTNTTADQVRVGHILRLNIAESPLEEPDFVWTEVLSVSPSVFDGDLVFHSTLAEPLVLRTTSRVYILNP